MSCPSPAQGFALGPSLSRKRERVKLLLPLPLAGEGRGPLRSNGKGEGPPARLAFAALTLLVLLATSAFAAAPVWKEFHSKAGGFEVLFPKAPQVKSEPPDMSGGVANVFTADLGTTAYVVSYTDYQPGTFAGRNPELIYNVARNDLVKGQPVKLLADRKAALSGRDGREVIFSDKEGYTQVYRFLVVKDRLYAVIAGGPLNHEKSAEAKRFFASFKLTAAH